MVTGQDAPRREYVAFSEEGRKTKARNGAASRPSAPSRCEAPHMGLAAADTKGQAAEGAVWVKMNVKEKSTGVPDARGSRRRREEREKDTTCRIRFPIWGSLCQKGGQQRKRDGLRFPSSRYGARTHD